MFVTALLTGPCMVGWLVTVWPAGNGRSQKPSLLDRATWWTVDDHFQQDVPAVLEYVLNATGAKQVHWVGHSMVSACAEPPMARVFDSHRHRETLSCALWVKQLYSKQLSTKNEHACEPQCLSHGTPAGMGRSHLVPLLQHGLTCEGASLAVC